MKRNRNRKDSTILRKHLHKASSLLGVQFVPVTIPKFPNKMKCVKNLYRERLQPEHQQKALGKLKDY